MAEHLGPLEIIEPPNVRVTVRRDVLASMVKAQLVIEGDGVIIVHSSCLFPRGLYGVTKIDGDFIQAEMLDYER